MSPFPHPHDGSDADDDRDGPPAGELPRKLRLLPLRPVLGDLPVRLARGRVRRFAPAWAVRFFPQWPTELVRRCWLTVVAGVCAAALVVSAARAVVAHERPLDVAVSSWTATPARRPLRRALAVLDWLDVVPVTLAAAIGFAAFCWRTRRDRLAVAVTLAAAAMVACYALLQLLLAPMEAAKHGSAGATPTADVRALAAIAVGWTVAFALRRDGASWRPFTAAIAWPLVVGVLRVSGDAPVSSVVAGWFAGVAVVACAALLWLSDRRRGTRLA